MSGHRWLGSAVVLWHLTLPQHVAADPAAPARTEADDAPTTPAYLPEVEVVAQRSTERTLFETPAAVTVVPASDPTRPSPSQVPDYLEGTPGVFLQHTTQGQAAPIIRGLIGSSTLMSERDLTDPRIDPEGTPGWATVNLRAGWQATDHLRLRLAVENVLDSNYRAHGSGMDAAGVNAIAGAELSF